MNDLIDLFIAFTAIVFFALGMYCMMTGRESLVTCVMLAAIYLKLEVVED